ncbi:MAG: zinc ABC transporter substrate-binding protein [Treponema sp.]|jgi:zinc transport system substrate-binding protein|nr:zinc ABC transporter substrate-binding protein [Treponema sp.]
MKQFLLLFFCVLLLFSACSRRQPNAQDGSQSAPPLIAVSIAPQAWFVSRIGGDNVRTLVLAGQGQNPHSYEPSARQLQSLSTARAWILSGAEFEISLLPKIKRLFPSLPIADGTAGVVFRELEEDEADHDVHSPHNIDRHTWLGSEPAKILAAHIRDTLSLIDPAGTEQYAAHYETLVREIDAEFAALRIELAPLRGRNVFVYHPAFGYFLDEFGIRQQAVETGGKEPGPRDLSRLIALAKQEQAAAIFVQAQFPVNAAKTVADAVGAELISLDPLAGDWLANIRLMGEALKAAANSGGEEEKQ